MDELYDPNKHGQLVTPSAEGEVYDPNKHGEIVSAGSRALRKGETGNLLNDWAQDAGNLVDGVVQMVTSPVQTAEGLWDLTKGVASKALNKSGIVDKLVDLKGQSPEVTALDKEVEKQKAKSREKTLDAVIADKSQDYGSVSDAVHTLTHRPLTALMDASTVLAPANALPGRVGTSMTTMSNAMNPLNAAQQVLVRGMRPIGNYARSAATVDRAGVTGRSGLSQEFEVPLTRGQVADDARLLGKEDRLRHEGGTGGEAQRVMQGFDQRQDTAIDRARNSLRSGLTGSANAMNPNQIGTTISEAFRNANNAARQRVTQMYNRAFNPDELARAGVAADIPIETVYGLRNNIENAFLHSDRPGGVLMPTPETMPNTMAAVRMLNQFSETGGVPSAFPRATMPPAGGNPLVTGVNWQQMDLIRKGLDGLRRGAANNPTDRAGMRRIMDVFDEELGRQNPLLNEARAAHAERVNQFDPQRTNAKGSNSFLRDLANNNNPGQTIYNALFEGAPLKRGEAGPLINQLQNIFAENPQAMSAVREGALQRLFVDARTGEALSPKKTANAVQQALNGPQGEVYRALFAPADIQRLQRFRDLLDHIGDTRTAQNPSKTSYPLLKYVKSKDGATVGAMGGAALGTAVAGPVGGTIGGGVGVLAGGVIDNLLAHMSANRAVGGQYSPPSVYPRVASGIAAADRGLNAAAPTAANLGRLSTLQPKDEKKRR